jgi:hypothetical protein
MEFDTVGDNAPQQTDEAIHGFDPADYTVIRSGTFGQVSPIFFCGPVFLLGPLFPSIAPTLAFNSRIQNRLQPQQNLNIKHPIPSPHPVIEPMFRMNNGVQGKFRKSIRVCSRTVLGMAGLNLRGKVFVVLVGRDIAWLGKNSFVAIGKARIV